MKKYICSVCYKETESGQLLNNCPSCGAEINKIHILENNIINDEMAVTLNNLRLLLKLLDSYIEKEKYIKINYQNQLDSAIKRQNTQLKNCSEKHERELFESENQHKNLLVKSENDYKNILSEKSSRLELYKSEQENVAASSRKYKEDIKITYQNRKIYIENIIKQVSLAEAAILSKKYHRMAENHPPAVDMGISGLDGIMAVNPMQLAKDLNSLSEKFLQRLIRTEEIERRFIEFYSIRVKAQQLYKKELLELDAMLSESESKAERMISEARLRFNTQISEHEKEVNQIKQNYIKYINEIKNKYNKERGELIEKQALQKKELLEQHLRQTGILEQNKKQELINFYQAMKEIVLNKIPPQTVAETVRNQKSRAKALKNNFTPAVSLPENITVGSLEYRIDNILSNKLIEDFIVNNYQAVINGNSLIFPFTVSFTVSFTVGFNKNLCLLFKYNNSQSAFVKEHMQNICLNAFLSSPPNKIYFNFFDPLKFGQSFESFKYFKYFENNPAFTYSITPAEIEQRLQNIAENIKTMQAKDSDSLNILGIMDFPAGFITLRSVELLRRIVATGTEYGVYTIIMCNTDNFALADTQIQKQINNIFESATVYLLKQKGYYLEENNKIDENMIFTFDSPPDIKKIFKN